MSASELKVGDRIAINGKAYCVKVEDGEVALRPFNPTPQAEVVRVAAVKQDDLWIADTIITDNDREWAESTGAFVFDFDPTTGRVVADEPWVEKVRDRVRDIYEQAGRYDVGEIHGRDLTTLVGMRCEEVMSYLPAPREAEDDEAKAWERAQEPDCEAQIEADAEAGAALASDDIEVEDNGGSPRHFEVAEPDAYPNAVGPVKEKKPYPPFDIAQCKRDNGAALKVGGFETNKGHAPIPVRVLSFGGYGAHGRSRHRLPVEFENGTWGRVKISNLANIERAAQEDADE